MMERYRNVCEIIVPNDLCIGCGICAAICPVDVLEMGFSVYGEYRPAEVRDGCLPKCDLCIRACPFSDQEENEDSLARKLFSGEPEIRHRVETGYYLDCYVGHSSLDDRRLARSSGGLATWFLQKLMEERLVDKVICVASTDDAEKMRTFAVVESVDQLLHSSRSSYYPVEMGTVLREITKTDSRYAITGQPCFIKGLRLAMRTSRALRERLVVLVGLVCGQSKSKFFVEYVASLKGCDPHQLLGVRFRVKAPGRPATDYGLQFEWRAGAELKGDTVFWSEGMQKAWRNDYFKPNPCNFCDDVFAETADLVFMDAWLPEYRNDYRGCSLVLNRRDSLKGLLDSGLSSEELNLDCISVEKVVKSQRALLQEKRHGIQHRAYLCERDHRWVPKKRWPAKASNSYLDRHLWQLKDQARILSRVVWYQGDKDLKSFRSALGCTDTRIWLIRSIQRFSRMLKEQRVRQAVEKRAQRVSWEIRKRWRK